MTNVLSRALVRTTGIVLFIVVFLFFGSAPVGQKTSLLGVRLLPCLQVAQAVQVLQDDDIFGDSVVKKKPEKKAPVREANPFTPQAAPDPDAPKEGDVKPGAPIPKVMKDGKVIYERPQDKDP
ncbi:MAG: hypothetical protein Q4G59_05770, partial [Planctomycetia bacterium]|nr:hypothetical protein [Planctomycetia bacterium]